MTFDDRECGRLNRTFGHVRAHELLADTVRLVDPIHICIQPRAVPAPVTVQ